ncbi:MAG TPA: ATP-binding protein [Kofleriaceae bacterium]|nr:ATP-binding protein [Kofleriaceae bacterium]
MVVGIGAAVAIGFALASVLVYVLARASLYEQLDRGLREEARAVAGLVEQEGDGLDHELAADTAPSDPFALWDEAGRRVAGRGELRPVVLVADGVMSIDDVTLSDGERARQVTFRFVPRNDEDTAAVRHHAVLAIARPTAALEATLARLAVIVAIVGGAATLLCLAMVLVIVRFALAPVRRVASAIAERSESNLAPLDASDAPEELGVVVRRLDELLRRLDLAFARERELTADVAHELRTPLAGLRATIEVALDRERTPERYRATLAECLAICASTERVVEALLVLARLDAGSVRVRPERVRLDELVRERWARFAARAAERGVVVELDVMASEVTSDLDQLRVVIDNLLDNAVSYCDPGGGIAIVVAGDRLQVTNTAAAVVEPAKLFERFWRGDAARTAGIHAGLGLSLCKKLVELLGGRISATHARGELAIVVVLSETSNVVIDRSQSAT